MHTAGVDHRRTGRHLRVRDLVGVGGAAHASARSPAAHAIGPAVAAGHEPGRAVLAGEVDERDHRRELQLGVRPRHVAPHQLVAVQPLLLGAGPALEQVAEVELEAGAARPRTRRRPRAAAGGTSRRSRTCGRSRAHPTPASCTAPWNSFSTSLNIGSSGSAALIDRLDLRRSPGRPRRARAAPRRSPHRRRRARPSIAPRSSLTWNRSMVAAILAPRPAAWTPSLPRHRTGPLCHAPPVQPRIVVVTGSASGMGAATRARLEADGQRVVGVDLRDAEVVADLGTPAGRQAAIDAVAELAGGSIDGLVTWAGVAGLTEGPPGSLLVSVNYFGTVALLEGLRPLLAAGDRPAADRDQLQLHDRAAEGAARRDRALPGRRRAGGEGGRRRRRSTRHLSGDQDGHRLVGPPQRARSRLGRRRHHPQRGRARARSRRPSSSRAATTRSSAGSSTRSRSPSAARAPPTSSPPSSPSSSDPTPGSSAVRSSSSTAGPTRSCDPTTTPSPGADRAPADHRDRPAGTGLRRSHQRARRHPAEAASPTRSCRRTTSGPCSPPRSPSWTATARPTSGGRASRADLVTGCLPHLGRRRLERGHERRHGELRHVPPGEAHARGRGSGDRAVGRPARQGARGPAHPHRRLRPAAVRSPAATRDHVDRRAGLRRRASDPAQRAAVDDVLRTGHEGRLLGREEQHHLGDLVGPAPAGDRPVAQRVGLGRRRRPCRSRSGRGAPSSPGCRRGRARWPRSGVSPRRPNFDIE